MKKSKIKSYEVKINTDLNGKRIPTESPHCICLSVILIDVVFGNGKNYYLYVFLGECKYVLKERKS